MKLKIPSMSGAFALLLTHANDAAAQVFNGGGVDAGLNEAEGVTGIADGDPRTVVIRILATVLDFLALFAMIMVIIAGFYLVFSFGDDDNKEKAKKIIYYTLIGLVVILFSRVIVSLVTVWLAEQIQ